jgi:hypothetical protein
MTRLVARSAFLRSASCASGHLHGPWLSLAAMPARPMHGRTIPARPEEEEAPRQSCHGSAVTGAFRGGMAASALRPAHATGVACP